MESKNKHN